MCWNASVSLYSFLLGSISIGIGSIYGLSLPLLFFFSTICLMQFVEFIQWSYGSNPSINFYTSIMASILLGLQPIASILTLYPHKIIHTLLFLYILLEMSSQLLLITYHKKPITDLYRMYPGTNGHLVWNWLQPNFYTIIQLCIYFVFLLLPLIISKNWSFLLFGIITLIVSLYSYLDSNTWGSMWCWIVNLSIIFIGGKIAVSKLLEK
jgi:hypothetical protein